MAADARAKDEEEVRRPFGPGARFHLGIAGADDGRLGGSACSGGRSRLDLEYDDSVGGCERGLRGGVERLNVEVVAIGDGA